MLETACCTKLLHQFDIILTSLRGLCCYHHILTLWQEQPNSRTTGKFTELLLFSLLRGSRLLVACFYYEGIGQKMRRECIHNKNHLRHYNFKKESLCYTQQKTLHSWCFGTAYKHRVAASKTRHERRTNSNIYWRSKIVNNAGTLKSTVPLLVQVK